jgi:hypothetical protein
LANSRRRTSNDLEPTWVFGGASFFALAQVNQSRGIDRRPLRAIMSGLHCSIPNGNKLLRLEYGIS